MDNQLETSGSGTPQMPTPSTPEIPVTSDPVKFMNDFEASDYFKLAYDKFYEGKNPAAGVTEEEKYDAFAESEGAKLALLDFGEKQEHYHYDPSLFPFAIKLAIEDYIDQTRDMARMMGAASKDEIISADLLRTTYHDLVAHGLKDAGLVGSYRLGKAFARLILIDRHLETFESSKQSDLLRLKRFLGAV